MNKQELIASVASKLDVSKASIKVVLNEILATVTDTLTKGDKVSLIDIGTLKPVQRKAKIARNPKTGAKVNVPAKKTVTFKASKSIKTKLN